MMPAVDRASGAWMPGPAPVASRPVEILSNEGLLPAPTTSAPLACSDGLAELFRAAAQLRDGEKSRAVTLSGSLEAARTIALREREEAVRRAREEAGKGDLIGAIAGDIGLAGAVGLVTFQYALVAADVAFKELDVADSLGVDVVDLGAAATGRVDVLAAEAFVRKTNLAPDEARELLAKCGIPKDAPGITDADVKPVARELVLANLVALSVAGSVLTAGGTGAVLVAACGLALSYGGGLVAEHATLDPLLGKNASRWVGFGMQVVGAAAASMSGLAGGAALPKGVEAVARAAGGAATSFRGAAGIVQAVHEYASESALLDEERGNVRVKRVERLLDGIVSELERATKTFTRTAELARSCVETHDRTELSLTHGLRG